MGTDREGALRSRRPSPDGSDVTSEALDGAPQSRRLCLAGYELSSRLAVGGMSEVFLAQRSTDGPNGPTLVIKRLLEDLVVDAEARNAFAQEGRIHAAIRHPNVVEVYEVGEHMGEPFLALEYVRGVDAHRLLKRAEAEGRRVAPGVAVHVAREMCGALEAVHGLRDEAGQPLRVVHRDITPSNVYLSMKGDVKLGDFGIAWTASARKAASGLKGKMGYLAPEQVCAEPFDHRADLFSLAVILAELVMGHSLFEGAGQLAILLAIRDGRIDKLRAIGGELPPGLFEVMERALARAPADRYQTASELADALAPFEASRVVARKELSALVAWARDASSLAKRLEGYLLDARKSSQPIAAEVAEQVTMEPAPVTRRVGEVGVPELPAEAGPASVRSGAAPRPHEPQCSVRPRGKRERNLPFAKLIEAIATGQLDHDDEVDIGQGMRPLGTIAALARYLPKSTGTTTRVAGPGVPDYHVELSETPLPEVLTWVLQRLGTGALFLEAAEGETAPFALEKPTPPRKELYFEDGRLVLAASTEPSELLGEYLVRTGKIDRTELELAILVMHKYDGHLGDTLIALGLVDPVAVFQAIRAQGRERVTSAFSWLQGRASFYLGVRPIRNDFRLDLDIPALILTGLGKARPEAIVLGWYEEEMETRFAQVRPMPAWAKRTTWPSTILALLQALGTGRKLLEAVDRVVQSVGKSKTGAQLRPAEVLRSLEAALLMGLACRLGGGDGAGRDGERFGP